MSIRFHNTVSRQLEEFVPQTPNRVAFYACGPTVYNFPHIGNLRTFLFEDLLRRWLEYRGYELKFAMNLTDVDDKTIKGSIAKSMSLSDYTAIYKKAFFDDLKTLNILPANVYPEATAHIPEMIDWIKLLLEKGYAYESSDGVYFKVSAFKDYGRLANLEHSELKAGASGRLSSDEYSKEDIADFALWKKWNENDGAVKWDADFGAGRPGWHLECSVMSTKYLGETIDIHAGGVDLIFPHHTNEIAQTEAITGKTFVNYWLHASHLIVDGEKMSKSKGNFYTLRDLLDKGYNPRSIRYALLTTHYRKSLNFTFDLIKQADSSLKRIDDFLFELGNIQKNGQKDEGLSKVCETNRQKFEASMDEDLNIAEAMAAVFDTISAFYDRKEAATKENATEMVQFFQKIDGVLGFIFVGQKDEISAEDLDLIEARTEAKKNRDFTKADEIRNTLLSKGIEVRDTKDGVVWKRI